MDPTPTMAVKDDLIEEYLVALDSYEKAQMCVGSSFASGFMDLAKANQSQSLNTRFGQDMYDDRIKALKQVTNCEPLYITTTDVKNPLNMFGILVPPSLRAAQQAFSCGLDAVVDVINSKAKVEQLEKDIARLTSESSESSRLSKATESTQHPEAEQ
jgi:hypothetical protein